MLILIMSEMSATTARHVSNSDQADADGDLVGDACELGDGSACASDSECSTNNCVNAVTADWYDDTDTGACCPEGYYWSINQCVECTETDGDEVCDDLDNCPTVYNPLQTDTDSDGFGDDCESLHGTDPNNSDTDGDLILDGEDNCPLLANPDQEDLNANGIGDWCEGLVAFYPFSGNADDASGNSNNGTVIGGAALAPDRFGNVDSAYSFDGTSGYIEIPDSVHFNFNQPITLTAWIYLNDNGQGGIVGQWGYGGSGPDAFLLSVTDAKLRLTLPQPGLYDLISTSDLNLNQWLFVSVVYDGIYPKLFLNGEMDATGEITMANVDSDLPFKIGLEEIFSGQQNYLNGMIDEVRIYNRALSDTEIQALFNQSGPTDLEYTDDLSQFGVNWYRPQLASITHTAPQVLSCLHLPAMIRFTVKYCFGNSSNPAFQFAVDLFGLGQDLSSVRFYFDRNQNGDLTDDGDPLEMPAGQSGKVSTFSVPYDNATARPYSFEVYVYYSDPAQDYHVAYYRDCGWTGDVEILQDQAPVPILVLDDNTDGLYNSEGVDYVVVDIDGDGIPDGNLESGELIRHFDPFFIDDAAYAADYGGH